MLQIVHILRVYGRLLHQFRGISRHWRFISVAIHTVFAVRFVNVPTIHPGPSAVVLVTFNLLQLSPRVLLCGEQRHLVVRPAVRAPFRALIVRLLHFIIGREPRAVRVADGFRVFVIVIIAGNIEHLLLQLEYGERVAAVRLLNRDIDLRVFGKQVSNLGGQIYIEQVLHTVHENEHDKYGPDQNFKQARESRS